MAKEKDLEKICRGLTEELGGELLKFVSPGNSGVQDRILMLPRYGFIAFVEFKKPGEKLRPKQQHWHKRMGELGQFRYVVDNLTMFKAILRYGPGEYRAAQKALHA